jgi:predicted nucleic acid-binding protein
MSDTLVDANVLIDIFAADLNWQDWSARQLIAARRTGELVINPIVYAEVAASFPTQRKLDEALGVERYKREDLPWDAAFNAARAFLSYRRSGGLKRSPLPDFYIGAHADLRGYFLLTRDAGRYRQAFPVLKIISPETHP